MERLGLIKRINDFLCTQHIIVPNDWLDACLEWLQTENQTLRSQNTIISLLQKQVYEQWLLTDLHELSTPVLPCEVASEKYTLNGIFCLQLNSILNVSQPLYGQLLEVQKNDDSNSTVSAETQATQKPWESKSARMLLMQLTDGVSEVTGMEYRNINCLSTKLSPGSKVRLKGPISCRRGVLLLTSNNLELLGGEVEELFSLNNHHAVLCRHLGQDLPNNVNNSIGTASNRENDSALELPDELLSQLTDDAFNVKDESGYATGTHVSLPDHSDDVTSDPMPVDDPDDVIDYNMLVEIERVEATQRSINSQTTNQPISRALLDGKAKEQSINSRSTKAVIDSTDVSSEVVQSQPRKHPKQLKIEDAFNQRFKTLPEPLQRCASGRLPSESSVGRAGCSEVSSSPSLDPTHGASAPGRAVKSESKCVSGRENWNTTRRVSSKDQLSALPRVSFPLKYLCQIKSLSTELKTQPTTLLVKACIVTLLSKLNSNPVQGWVLSARICDGTDVLDVQFSDQVLTNLIGYSSSQAEDTKKSFDPDRISGLKDGMSKCRDAIIEMCKLMLIKLTPESGDLPIVLQLKDVDHAYWESFS